MTGVSSVPDKLRLSREEFFNQPDGFPFEEFNPDDVVLPPGDDLGVASDDDEAADEGLIDSETGFSTSIGNILDVDLLFKVLLRVEVCTCSVVCSALEGLPVVHEDKFEKLKALLLNRFRAHGEVKEGRLRPFCVVAATSCTAAFACVMPEARTIAGCFWMPKDGHGKTKGCAFIEYSGREV